MSCEHLIFSPTDQSHVLPCRHKFCIPCTENIDGLMTSEIFSCPVCGGCSQYVDPRRKVYGEERSTVTEDQSMDYSYSTRSTNTNMPHTWQLESDSCGGTVTDKGIRSTSADTKDHSDLDRDLSLLMANTGVRKTAFEMEQREAWKRLENDRQHSRKAKTPSSSTSQTYNQVATLDTNDGRGSFGDPGSGRVRNNQKSERGGKYDISDNTGKEDDSAASGKPLNPYDAEGRCLNHKRFIAFACEECDTLLCELCKSAHELEYHQHTVSRLKEEEKPEVAPNLKEDNKITATTYSNCNTHLMPCVMYCKTQSCRKMLCKLCLDSHYGYCHDTLPIRDVRNSMYKQFTEYLNRAEGLKADIGKISQNAENNVSFLLEEGDKLKDKVKKATDEAVKQLLENQEVMLEQIDSEVKKKTVAHQTSADKANAMTETLNTIEEAAQGAFKTVEDSNFPLAQIFEDEVSQNMNDLEKKLRSTRFEPPPRDSMELRCEYRRIAKYWPSDGVRSEAPVRLNKPTSFNISSLHFVYF